MRVSNRPVRVLYALNAAAGGATQGIVELLRGLPRDRFEAYLAVPEPPDEHQKIVFSALTCRTFIVPMRWWNRKTSLPPGWRIPLGVRDTLETWGHGRSVWSLVRLIRAQQIDLVYTNSVMTLDGALAARYCGIPHIWHLKEWFGSQARVKFWLPDSMLARFIRNFSTRVLVMTRFIGEIFERYDLRDRITVVNDGVDVTSFGQEARGGALRQSLGVTDEQFLIGMAASLSSTWKQHSVFIEMAARLVDRFPQIRFAAFGPEPQRHRNPAYNQPWRYYQGLRAQVTRLGLNDKFIWAGFHRDIPQMMDAVDVLVHPCAQEPFGRVAIEAMAAQCPVVGPNTGGIAESVIDGETGILVPAGDVSAFADATARLVSDSNLRQRMGAAGRAHAAKNFSLEQHVAQISNIYDEILKR